MYRLSVPHLFYIEISSRHETNSPGHVVHGVDGSQTLLLSPRAYSHRFKETWVATYCTPPKKDNQSVCSVPLASSFRPITAKLAIVELACPRCCFEPATCYVPTEI